MSEQPALRAAPPRKVSESSLWREVAMRLQQGDLHGAEEALRTARKLEPNPIADALAGASISWRHGFKDAAIALLSRTVRKHPKAAPLHAALAEYYLALDRPELALEWATQAAKLRPLPVTEALLKRVHDVLFNRLLDVSAAPEDSTVMFDNPFAEDRRTESVPQSWSPLAGEDGLVTRPIKAEAPSDPTVDPTLVRSRAKDMWEAKTLVAPPTPEPARVVPTEIVRPRAQIVSNPAQAPVVRTIPTRITPPPPPEPTPALAPHVIEAPLMQAPPKPAERAPSKPAHVESPHSAERKAAALEHQQIDALLGGKLFAASVPTRVVRSRDKRGFDFVRVVQRLAILVFIGSFVMGAASFMSFGLERKARGESDALAKELRQLLRIGSYEPASTLTGKLDAMTRAAGLEKSFGDLVLLSNALLYRFHDGDPVREQLVKAGLEKSVPPSTDRILARAALNIETDATSLVPELREMMSMDKDDLHVAELLGMAASRSGNQAIAEKSFARAEALEPPQLAYLYQQLEHWLRYGRKLEAKNLVGRMTDVNPSSPWSKLGRFLTGDATTEELQTVLDSADAPPNARAAAKRILDSHR
jgi:tetratricopeptide (TPR) repeat protein